MYSSEKSPGGPLCVEISKIIDKINKRVEDSLSTYADNHEHAEDGGFLFKWIVVLICKPL